MQGPWTYDGSMSGNTIFDPAPWGRRDDCPRCGGADVVHVVLTEALAVTDQEPPEWVFVARETNRLGHDRLCRSCDHHWASGRG